MSRKGVQLRQVLLGTVGGAAVFAGAWAVAYVVVLALNAALWPGEDTTIGSGLILLAIPAAVVPLALWALLRRLGVPGAVLIGAGGIVVYVLAVQVGTEQAAYHPMYVTAAAGSGFFALYSGLATVLAGAIAGLRGRTA